MKALIRGLPLPRPPSVRDHLGSYQSYDLRLSGELWPVLHGPLGTTAGLTLRGRDSRVLTTRPLIDWLRWGEREWGWGFAIFASQPGYLYPSIPTGAPARLTDDTPFWGHGLDFSGCLCPRIRVTPSAQTATCAADH